MRWGNGVLNQSSVYEKDEWLTWYPVHVPTWHRVSFIIWGAVRCQRQYLTVAEHFRWRTTGVTVTEISWTRGYTRDIRSTKPVSPTCISKPCFSTGPCCWRHHVISYWQTLVTGCIHTHSLRQITVSMATKQRAVKIHLQTTCLLRHLALFNRQIK